MIDVTDVNSGDNDDAQQKEDEEVEMAKKVAKKAAKKVGTKKANSRKSPPNAAGEDGMPAESDNLSDASLSE